MIATAPKAGQVEPHSVVKIYYVTTDIIEESKLELEKAQKANRALEKGIDLVSPVPVRIVKEALDAVSKSINEL